MYITEHYFEPLPVKTWDNEELSLYWQELGKRLLLETLYPGYSIDNK